MEPASVSSFVPWVSFYVIIGSSAAALTGLQFVVMVLGAEMSSGATEHTTSVFGTPTIVHFCAVLLNAAIVSAPWPALWGGAAAIALFSAAGVVYMLLVMRHARRQTDYVPVLEDWLWHVVLPLLSYAALLVSGAFLTEAPGPLLFVVGTASLLLLFVGIHNAWDSVTYLALTRRRRDQKSEAPGGQE